MEGSSNSVSLNVSWCGTCGVTYMVRYSTSSGTISEPPLRAASVSVTSGNSTLLTGLSLDTTYYVWVAAVSSGTQGPYSNRVSATIRSGTYIYKYTGCTYICTYIYIVICNIFFLLFIFV